MARAPARGFTGRNAGGVDGEGPELADAGIGPGRPEAAAADVHSASSDLDQSSCCVADQREASPVSKPSMKMNSVMTPGPSIWAEYVAPMPFPEPCQA